MSSSSLSRIITDKFITRIAAATQKASGSTSSNPLKSGSSQTTLSGSLRLGAQTYATAIQGLNNTLSIVNVSKSTLEKLGDITDQMIELAEQAATRPVGPHGRRSIDVKFRDLADDFKKIVEKSKIGDNNFLSTEGLTEIFLSVGLDKETSESIAAVFEKFLTPNEDDKLASEEVKGKRPFVIPSGAFETRSRPAEYNLQKVTNYDLTEYNGGISSVNSVFSSTDTILNQNTDIAVFTASASTGSVTTQPAGSLEGNTAVLMAVNETTGYSIVQTKADPLGENAGGATQLFLVDEVGQFVGQLTNNDGTYEYLEADLSSNNDNFVYIMNDGGQNYVTHLYIEAGSSPSVGVETVIDRNTDPLTSPKIDNEGTHILYQMNSGGYYAPYLVDLGTMTTDYDFAAVSSTDPILYGFSSPKNVIYSTGSGGIADIGLYDSTSIAFTTFQTGLGLESLAVLQAQDGEDPFYATVEIDDSLERGVFLYNAADPGTVLRGYTQSGLYTTAPGSEVIQSLSLAYNSQDSNEVDIGFVASWYGLMGDNDTEVYRVSYRPPVVGRSLADDSTDYTEILDPARHINSRPAAYRMLNDLKSLREQISKNVEALTNAFKVVADNIQLVRATGLALLDIGNSITSADNAATVAESLRRRIKQQVPEALAQAENLDPIAVATLTYSGKGN